MINVFAKQKIFPQNLKNYCRTYGHFRPLKRIYNKNATENEPYNFQGDKKLDANSKIFDSFCIYDDAHVYHTQHTKCEIRILLLNVYTIFVNVYYIQSTV